MHAWLSLEIYTKHDPSCHMCNQKVRIINHCIIIRLIATCSTNMWKYNSVLLYLVNIAWFKTTRNICSACSTQPIIITNTRTCTWIYVQLVHVYSIRRRYTDEHRQSKLTVDFIFKTVFLQHYIFFECNLSINTMSI